MDTRGLQASVAKLRATQAQLDTLAAETDRLTQRLAIERRTQRLLLVLTLAALGALIAGLYWMLAAA